VLVLKLPEDGRHLLKKSEFESPVPPSDYVRDVLSGDGVTVADIADDFEGRLGVPVLDESGLEGRWDYELRCADTDSAVFAAAVREQLGLELIPERRVIEVLVIKSNSPPPSPSTGLPDSQPATQPATAAPESDSAQ